MAGSHDPTGSDALTLPLRVLAMIAAPTDGPAFDAARAWQQLEQSLASFVAQGQLVLERLPEATESALKSRLAQGPVHVLHFIGHGRAQQSARYATLAFVASDGRSRNLSAQFFSTLLRQHAALRLVVLQAGTGGREQFGGMADPWLSHSRVTVVTDGFVDQLARLVADARRTRSPPAPAAAPSMADQAATPSAEEIARAADAARARERQEQTRRMLEQKRVASAFDVFLCHSWVDKPAVKAIAQQLKAQGILPWLDEWELPPGQPWQQLLEQQIANIKSAAVFVGAGGVGPWQEQELYGFLREFVARRSPVIPVLLVNAPEQPKLPVFLNAMTWVDFRRTDPDPLARLIWGITGKRADD